MKTKYWSVSSIILEGGPRKPELKPKATRDEALTLRTAKMETARRDLELKKEQLKATARTETPATCKAKTRVSRKESSRVPSGLDWHFTNNDK